MADDLERTLDADDILGLFGSSAESSVAASASASSHDNDDDDDDDDNATVNPHDFSALLNQVSPVPLVPSAAAASSSSRLSSSTPSPRLTPSCFTKQPSSSSRRSSLGGSKYKRGRETLNPNDLSFLNEIIPKPLLQQPVVVPHDREGEEEDVTVDPNLLFSSSSMQSPPHTPSFFSTGAATFFPAAPSVVVPKSILRTNKPPAASLPPGTTGAGAAARKVQSVQFGRTKSVLRFDNQFPVSRLKQEDETAVETPGRRLQMKEICEEVMDDDEQQQLSKRLNFKEEEEDEEEQDDDEFEKELFRQSMLRTEEEEEEASVSAASASSFMSEEDDSNSSSHGKRRDTLDVPSLADFAAVGDSTESFSFQRGAAAAAAGDGGGSRRDTLDVPSLMDFSNRQHLAGGGEDDTSSTGVRASPPRLHARRNSALLEEEEDREEEDGDRRQTLDVPSLAAFRSSVTSTSSSRRDLSPRFVQEEEEPEPQRRLTLDVPSFLDFCGRDSTLGGGKDDATFGGQMRRLTLDVPSFMDFRESVLGGESSPNSSRLRRDTLDVPSLMDFKRASIAPLVEEEEDDSLLRAAAPLWKQEDVLEQQPPTPAAAAPTVDALLQHFYPATAAGDVAPSSPPAPPPAAPSSTFQHDSAVDPVALADALINVHYTDNCVDFVENQLYQVALQRRALLPTTTTTSSLSGPKPRKQMKLARLEAEGELAQWQLQVQSEYLRSLANQLSRVQQDVAGVLLVEQVTAKQRQHELEQQVERGEQHKLRTARIGELRQKIRAGEDERLALATALAVCTERLTQASTQVDVLRVQADAQAHSLVKLDEFERQADMAKLKLALQQSLAVWELKRATATSAEVGFSSSSCALLIELGEEARRGGIRVSMVGEGGEQYVEALLRTHAVDDLEDLVHLLTLVEDHVVGSGGLK